MTILFTMVCALLAFSVLRWSMTERRLNSRSARWLAVRNAAEGVAEYGFSEVRNDFETKSTPGIYKPGTANALILPNASVFAGSSVVTGALSTGNPNGMELIADIVTRHDPKGPSMHLRHRIASRAASRRPTSTCPRSRSTRLCAWPRRP